MQTRQATRLDSEIREVVGVPSLPVLSDLVMPHIRRIADEGGHACTPGKTDSSVVFDQHGGPVGPTACAKVGAQHQRGQWVHFHGNKLCVRKGLTCSQNETPRARSRIYDATWCTLTFQPGQHRSHDLIRGVDGSGCTPFCWRSDSRKCLPKRIMPCGDLSARCDNKPIVYLQVCSTLGQLLFWCGQVLGIADQGKAQGYEVGLCLHGGMIAIR